jgi:hypothetical protein
MTDMATAPMPGMPGMAGTAAGAMPEMAHDHAHAEVVPPATGDPRFVDGTTGPPVKEGKAKTVKIPDGRGFGGVKGRKQNDGDKDQNNYSVTDANFNNQLGLLAKNPDTGETMNYVQHIQTYNAAGYLENFAPDVYAQLVANQNAGRGTVLGAAAHIMGLVQTADPAEQGVNAATVPATIPGSPIDAKAYVLSGKDITGQNWARMHHPESAWAMYKGLIEAGVDWKNAMVLSGDDAVSGAGRVNGVNNQDGGDGFNDGEEEVWSLGAQIQQQTGINVIQKMMEGHNHDTGQDASALTKPRINKKIGFDRTDRSASAERANAIAQVLLDGTVGDAKKAAAGGTKADNKRILNAVTGAAAGAAALAA